MSEPTDIGAETRQAMRDRHAAQDGKAKTAIDEEIAALLEGLITLDWGSPRWCAVTSHLVALFRVRRAVTG